jgi:hypothetical protein
VEEKEIPLIKKGVRKIANNSKRKLLFITLFFITMLISAAYASLIPTVGASEVTTQQKAITVLDSVVGLDASKFTTSLNRENKSIISGLPQEEIDFKLISSEDSLRVSCSFVNNKLQMLYLSDYTGSLSLAQPDVTPRDMAKDFMGRYQRYTVNPFYGELSSMLNGVAANENLTKTLGTVKLEVSVFDDVEYDLLWTYVDEKGVQALAKTVGLIYDHGRLQTFWDNWELYDVVGVPKLSREDAIIVALKAVQNFSWDAYTDNGDIVTVSDFEVVSIGDATLSYLNFQEPDSSLKGAELDEPRGGDQFTLYPSWYIPLGFDKFYPGSVTGAVVRVWADTGEIASIGPMTSGGAPLTDDIAPAEAEKQGSSLGVFFAFSVAIGVVAICFYGNKLRSNRTSQLKSGISKLSVTLICVMLSFSMIFAAIPTANAKRARTYASTYGQTSQDIYFSACLSYYITLKLSSAGYNAFNHGGSETQWSTYQQNTYYDQYYDTFNVVFHYGHMAGPGNLKLSDSNVLTSADVQSFMWTYDWRFRFVWLWACYQAYGPQNGMTPAWANHYEMESWDGYNYPEDDCPSVFMVFNQMSPSLVTGSFQGYTVTAYSFIVKVYELMLVSGLSVHDSLNSASVQKFHHGYNGSPLNAGFMSYWPGNYGDPPQPPGWYYGRMDVYGNSRIYLV